MEKKINDKEKQERIKELTKKYFWEQKKKELEDFFLILMGCYGFVGFMIFMFSIFSLVNQNQINITFLIVGIIPVIFWIIYGLVYWIDSNWKRSEEHTSELQSR
jgi:hypothetical protein